METNALQPVWLEIAGHGVASAPAFLATLLISSAVRANKGAKANRAWVAVALGLILIGVSEGSKLTTYLGFPLLENWDGLMNSVGAVLILFGALIWRGIVKKANT